MVYGASLLGVGGIIESFYIIFTQSKHSLGHIFNGMIPVAIFPIYYYSLHNYSEVYWEKNSLAMVNLAPFFCLCASRIIICSVAKQKFYTFEHLHLNMPIIISIIIFPVNTIFALGIDELLLYGFLIIYGYFMYFWYIVHTVNQICEYLDIYCLTIKHKKQQWWNQMCINKTDLKILYYNKCSKMFNLDINTLDF